MMIAMETYEDKRVGTDREIDGLRDEQIYG